MDNKYCCLSGTVIEGSVENFEDCDYAGFLMKEHRYGDFIYCFKCVYSCNMPNLDGMYICATYSPFNKQEEVYKKAKKHRNKLAKKLGVDKHEIRIIRVYSPEIVYIKDNKLEVEMF